MQLKIDPRNRVSRENGSKDSFLEVRHFVFIALVLTMALSVWFLRCEIGLGNCSKNIESVKIIYKKNSGVDEALSSFDRTPCSLSAKERLDSFISIDVKSDDMAQLWFNWGVSELCQMSQSERAIHFIRSYQHAKAAGNLMLMQSGIESALKLVPTSPEIHLTAANHYYNLGANKKSVESFKLAVYYAGGYQRISIDQLWLLSKALEKTQNNCEALGVLNHLQIRTRRQPEVDVAAKDILKSGKCELPFDEAVVLQQSSNKKLSVSIVLNGMVGSFLLDTGASITTISSEFANKIGKKFSLNNSMPIQTANGVVLASTITVETLSFGSNLWKNQVVLVSQGDFGSIDGLLGLDILSQYDILKDGKTWTLKRLKEAQ